MSMNSKREGIQRWWGGYHDGNDNRRDRRTARARRKVASGREVVAEIRPPWTADDFERCVGCGERYCDGC